jgi:uncharacterized protein YktA (UPF0223 family)
MNELEERLQMYEKTFGESFPTYPLMLSKTDEEMIEIIDKCLDAEQDVYEMGILKDDSNLKY